MSVSQKQIADALNLSTITVSRALRDYPHLAADTRERVLQKANELGYRKNRAQLSSPSEKVKRAGIIFFEAPDQAHMSFASKLKTMTFYSLQQECKRMKVETLIETVDLEETPQIVQNRTIDAAFIFGRYSPHSLTSLAGIPSLAVSSYIDGTGISRVIADNQNGMKLATEHLIRLGHRKIAFLGYKESHTRLFVERSNGYLLAMHENGLTPESHFIPRGQKDIRIPEGCTAIACSSDSMAYFVAHRLQAAGMSIPEDISIVGFDNLADEMISHSQKISSYGPNWEQMGRSAARILLSDPELCHQGEFTLTISGKLYDHGSTASPKS
ncbi:LacI family DNA-binding transcriptional regulator [Puniceicoccus vermicola]|uniref:LacI family DNA-binding transcriptional regulator n=1 Tax=Puniceicoccus vermicola TaxID=388746 RepID=A0A7X1AYA9_9BACT|nr:LacI family DNA-binding transcriptional regulator [Puniceicoccus vermicola]MBC2602144.1 LacI family DNA-binding transcriptional regulator [Puniceicoccus vermicola]